MLASRHRCLVFPSTHEDYAHAVFELLVDELERRISVSDPLLDALVVLDTIDHKELWDDYKPATEVTYLREFVDHRPVHQSHTVASFGQPFLEIGTDVPLTRTVASYSFLPDTSAAKALVRQVHPYADALFLGEES